MLAGLQAESRLAPRGDRRGQTNRALAFAAAVRVITRVHNNTADARADAHVTAATGLTDANVAVVSIAHGADGCLRVHGDHADFAGGQTDLRVRAFLSHQLSGVAGTANELAAAARNDLNVVDQRTERDVADRQGVARLDVRAFTADYGVAGLQVDRRQDVALLAVGVVEQRDERGAVRIVLDAGNLGRDAVLVALEVDHAVLDLVAAALMANGDLALLIAAGILLLAFQKGLFRRRLGDFLEGEHRHETSGRGSRLINTNSHFC